MRGNFLCHQLSTITTETLLPTLLTAKTLDTIIARTKKTNVTKKQSGKVMAECIKQVHQETLRYVNPLAQIKVLSDIEVQVKTCNVHDYPEGNVFIAELHGGPVRNCPVTMKVQVSPDDKLVEVKVSKVTNNCDDGGFQCELVIPIRASLQLHTLNSASAENLLAQALIIQASRFINVRNIRAEHIALTTYMGDIHCDGTFLANVANLRTNGSGVS